MVMDRLKSWCRFATREHGQALPLVLGFMALGALVVTPALNMAATSLDNSATGQHETDGIYAADAGVEYVLWCLQEGIALPAALPENINEHSVSLATEELGEFTFCFSEFLDTGEHANYLTVSGNSTWDDPADAYAYTIAVMLTPAAGNATIHLAEVGVRLPPGYTYVADSAAEFVDNLDTGEPESSLDSQGAELLRWQFDAPKPSLTQADSEASQTFHITGSGSLSGDYTWLVANRSDIGVISEISGTVYQVGANATHLGTGATSAKVEVDVIDASGTLYVVSWRLAR